MDHNDNQVTPLLVIMWYIVSIEIGAIDISNKPSVWTRDEILKQLGAYISKDNNGITMITISKNAMP